MLLDLLVLLFFTRYHGPPDAAFGSLGLLAFLAAAAYCSALVVWAYVFHVPTVREHSGWFLMSIMLLLASVQITMTGLLAEILVRVHYGIGDRRVYRVRDEWTRPRRRARRTS